MAAAPSRYSRNLLLVRRCQAGDRAAAEELLALNEPLVIKIAGHYVRITSSLEFEDLAQEGRLGLLRAAQSFDCERHLQFSTYAFAWIRQAIGRAILKQDRMIRIPDHQLARQRVGAAERPVCDCSLDQPTGDEDGTRLEELLAAGDDPEEAALARLAIAEALAVLSARERTVILARAAGVSLREVGGTLGMSREGVRQLEKRARSRALAGPTP
jgi:RNA polymerase primary sigma factor